MIIFYEFGLKFIGMDNYVCFNVDVYSYIMYNEQFIVVGGDINIICLINVKKIEGYGVEFDLEVYFMLNFVFIVGGSYNYIELKDLNLVVVVCGVQCIVFDLCNVDGNVLIDGNVLFNLFKWIGMFIVCYGILYGESGEFFVYIDWNYCSEVNFFFYDLVEFKGKLLFEGGLCVGYNWDYGCCEIVLYGCNIINKCVLIGVIDFNNCMGFVNDLWVIGVEFCVEL